MQTKIPHGTLGLSIFIPSCLLPAYVLFFKTEFVCIRSTVYELSSIYSYVHTRTITDRLGILDIIKYTDSNTER